MEVKATASCRQETSATVYLKTQPRLSTSNLWPPTAGHHCIQSWWRPSDEQLTWTSFINLSNIRLSVQKHLKHVSTHKRSPTKEDTIPRSFIQTVTDLLAGQIWFESRKNIHWRLSLNLPERKYGSYRRFMLSAEKCRWHSSGKKSGQHRKTTTDLIKI